MIRWILLLGINLLWAETAEEALRKSADFFRKTPDMALDLQVEVKMAGNEAPTKYTSKLWTSGANRYKLQLPGLVLLSDGKSLWEHHTDNKQVVIKNLADLENSFNPSEILLKYIQCKPVSKEEKKLNGKSYQVLVLDPKGQIPSLKYLEVWLDSREFYPKLIKVKDAAGNQTDYLITRLRNKVNFPKNFFVFTKQRHIDVIDMR